MADMVLSLIMRNSRWLKLAVVVWMALVVPVRHKVAEGATEGAGAGMGTLSGGAVAEPVVVAAVSVVLAPAEAHFLLGHSFAG